MQMQISQINEENICKKTRKKTIFLKILFLLRFLPG